MQLVSLSEHQLPVHVTDIWVPISGFQKKVLFGVFLYKGQYHACESKMNYCVPMYKGPLDAHDSDTKTKIVPIIKERVRLGIENKIAERGLDKVKSAILSPAPQLQRLEI